MKTLIACSLLCGPVALMAQDTTFTIKGSVGKIGAPATVYLSYRNNGAMVLDSAVLKKGSFTLKGHTPVPVMASISLDRQGAGKRGKDVLTLYVDKGTIRVAAADSLKNAAIGNSPVNSDYKIYKQYLAGPDGVIKQLDARWAASSDAEKKGQTLRDSLMKVHTPVMAEKKRLQKEFIAKYPASFISLVALKEIAGNNIDYAQVAPIFNGLSAATRNSKAGAEFGKRLDIAKSVSVGAMAPDFTQNDTTGAALSLSAFRGKYVLVDFWASWCGPCRAENPNIVKAYDQFRDKGFTILGVSLDNNMNAWKKAIVSDKLAWAHVSDLKFWNNEVAKQYDIRSVPANFLLDREGRIIAKNLRGEELAKQLAELLK